MKADVAVLALQGDFSLHVEAVSALGAGARSARTAKEILSATHLILPGGESTTMLKLLHLEGLEETIHEYHRSGRPIFATCAGVILLAKEVLSPHQHSLGLLDATVERNAYGRQVASFTEPIDFPAAGAPPVDAVFIRAPIIRSTGPSVETLAERETPVLVRDGNVLACTFHPELTDDRRIHEYFLEMS